MRTRTRTWVRAAGVLLLAAAAVTGCGDEDGSGTGGSGGDSGAPGGDSSGQNGGEDGGSSAPGGDSGGSSDWKWDPDAAPAAWHDAGGGAVAAFRVELPGGVGWEAAEPETEDCPAPRWWAEQDGAGMFDIVFQVSATPTSCEIDPDVNASPLNGRHPSYRTAEDIPAEIADGAREVSTALGPGLVFTQTYTECTNSCTDYEEPFVVVTLDQPADPEHQTVVFTSRHGLLTEDQLAEVVTEHVALP